MKMIISLGKYLLGLMFIAFDLMHLSSAPDFAASVPIPPAIVWVYVTGICLTAGGLSMIIGLYDKLAGVLLAVLMLIFAFAVHLPAMSENPMEMGTLLRNVGLAGGCLIYASSAKDSRVIG